MKNCKTVYCSGISYFSFPKDVAIRAKWIIACGKGGLWFPNKTAVICEKHFAALDMKLFPTKKKLLPGAVPINLDLQTVSVKFEFK